MDLVHERAAGIDISKRDAKVCVRVPGDKPGEFTSSVSTWPATTNGILELRDFLERKHVTTVVMEATGVFWKPFYYLLEETLDVMLVNARQAKNLPGRKTDVSDSMWLAQLGAHGLLRPSFVPPEPIRELRDLTRTRQVLVRDRTREIQRLAKFLESTGIKLSNVATDLMGASSRSMLEALIAGEHDPNTLAALARGKMRVKIPELSEALLGRFNAHDAFMVRAHLTQIDAFTAQIDLFTERIEEVMLPFRAIRDALTTIPGVSTRVADTIIAETGGNMSVFPTSRHLASWAGVCPSSNESAGRVKSTKIQPGNKYLKEMLGVAAISASRTKNTYLNALYHRLIPRIGNLKAIVALEHSILTSVYEMLTTGQPYEDLGPDHFTRLNPERALARHLRHIRNLGYNVTLTPIEAA